MNMLVLPFPNISEVALQLGPISVRWYGLAYMVGLLGGWYYIRKLLTTKPLWKNTSAFSADLVDDLLLWTTLGVVVGGRLGHVLLYSPDFFLANPLKILFIWEGGMSFHGGLLGTGIAFYLFSKRHNIDVHTVMDVGAAAVPIGLFFGRVANFINAEIIGKVTDVPWAFIFPGTDNQPRHPVQLYEAFLEGIVLFFVLRFFTHKRFALSRPGETVGLFLMGYGIARSFAEIFKDTNQDHLFTYGLIKPGMIYSIPMILLGLYFYRRAQKLKTTPTKA